MSRSLLLARTVIVAAAVAAGLSTTACNDTTAPDRSEVLPGGVLTEPSQVLPETPATQRGPKPK
jgi:hypothetical protein